MRKTKMMLLGVLLCHRWRQLDGYCRGDRSVCAERVHRRFHPVSHRRHRSGDVPHPEYNIKQWQQRNLPAPDAGSHWTYMGGNYVLITDTEGKILKVYDGEIFYHR
ncbi:nickel/cobalt homeostasis protein RcnB [Klebsiella pneumoniae]|uniref:Nickel/cobalt homeostasis protein RcnB n=1 Tax=Klebsiella pneumoniae TaxID=573 RepID=A0A377V4R7_KLEPN|nr:nickel/cobalt homeostasis protein RcnB [Klebsiella pneumoniae]